MSYRSAQNYRMEGELLTPEKERIVFNPTSISTLLDVIIDSATEKNLQPKECPQFRTLKEKCADTNVSVAFAAFQGFLQLVQKKILTGSQAVSSLISILPGVTHYTPLVTTIGNILLYDKQGNISDSYGYNLTDKLHPFIIILKHDAEKSWDSIFGFIQFLFYRYENVNHGTKLALVEPVFFYVFCNQACSVKYKNEIFLLLLDEITDHEIICLIMKGLAWQKLDTNYCWVIQRIVQALLKSTKNYHLVIGALTPFLATAAKWLILNGQNPCVLIDLISASMKIDNSGANAVLYILSDAILQCPSLFIVDLVDLCASIIFSFSCNKYIAYKFAAISLIRMVNFPSGEVKKSEHVIKHLINNFNSCQWRERKNNLNNNPYFKIIQSSQNELKIAENVGVLSDDWGYDKDALLKWLENLYNSNNMLMEVNLHTFISGIFMFETDEAILKICLKIFFKTFDYESNYSFYQICLTLFKLSRESEPKMQFLYLQSLVKMANSKENIPLIIGILESLKYKNSQVMLSVVVDLYLKLWMVDNRTYPYLYKALFNCPEHSWELNVMRTIALREICRAGPEIHGKSLVSKLSEILNECDNYASGLPSAIAIEAVIELCKASVIDISGTWKALKPKLSRDQRPEVIVSLCKLFGEIPSLKTSDTERESLIADVIPRLWRYAFSRNLGVVKAALKALLKYNTDSYGAKLLPNELKSNIQIPKNYTKSRDDCSIDCVSYIPGECWITFIKIIDSEAKDAAMDMISSLIEEELSELPRRFFFHPGETPEPNNYTHLPHNSVCRALVACIKDFIKTKDKNIPVADILKILSSDYSKCLPLLDWSFLKNLFTLNEDYKIECLKILAKQSSISKASRKEFESYIIDNLEKFTSVNDFFFLYTALPSVCNALGASILRQFLDKTLRISCITSLNSETNYFVTVVASVTNVLESKNIPEPRKALLVTHMKNILSYISPKHEIMTTYGNFAAGLPEKVADSIVSPLSWSKVTSDNVRRSVLIRSSIAIQSKLPKPLAGFREIIEAAYHMPEEYFFIVKNISQVLQYRRDICHDYWLEELMRMIQSFSAAKDATSIKAALFLLEMFVLSVIIVCGHDCFLQSPEHWKSAPNVFAAALAQLLVQPSYSSLSTKVIEWIHNLTTWKSMPESYVIMLRHAILALRNNRFCSEKNKYLHIFYDAATMRQ